MQQGGRVQNTKFTRAFFYIPYFHTTFDPVTTFWKQMLAIIHYKQIFELIYLND